MRKAAPRAASTHAGPDPRPCHGAPAGCVQHNTPARGARSQGPAQHGVRSSLSVPVPYQGTVIGALNAYSSKPAASATPEAVDATLIVAETVAVAMVNARAHGRLAEEAANLRLAMESRAVIEQAKGVIMRSGT